MSGQEAPPGDTCYHDPTRYNMKNVLLLCVFIMASCSLKPAQIDIPAGADAREQELRGTLAEAEPLVRNVLNSLNTGGYESYSRNFDDSGRAAFSEEQFSALQKKTKDALGPYEDGKYQVHKIEQYASYCMIFYFVKFKNVDYRNPIIVTMKIKKVGDGLKILDINYRHALLEAQTPAEK